MLQYFLCMIIFNADVCYSKPKYFDYISLQSIKRFFVRDVKSNISKGYVRDRVYLHSSVKVPCMLTHKLPEKTYNLQWKHGDKIILDHYTIDESGSLVVHNVTIRDAGVYFCEIDLPEGKKEIQHTLEVFQVPSIDLKISFYYNIQMCNPDTEKQVDFFIRSKIRHCFCSTTECNIDSVHTMCFRVEVVVPSLKVTVSIILRRTPNWNCDIDCTRKKLKDVTEETTREILELVMAGRRLKLQKEKTGLSISYYDSQTDVICDAGLEMKDFDSKPLCVPCKPGHFLDRKYCIPCHLNHYSEHYGASKCRPCGSELRTRKRGAISQKDCKTFYPNWMWMLAFATVFLVSLTFVTLCLCCCRCCPGKKTFCSCICYYCVRILSWGCIASEDPADDDDALLLNETDVESSTETEGLIKSTRTSLAFAGTRRTVFDNLWDKRNDQNDQRKRKTNQNDQWDRRNDQLDLRSDRSSDRWDRRINTSSEKKSKMRILPPPVMPTDSMLKKATKKSLK